MPTNPFLKFRSGQLHRWKVLTWFVLAVPVGFLSISFVESKENAKDLALRSDSFEVNCSSKENPWVIAFRESQENHSTEFEFPVGTGGVSTPAGYYNAQEFGENNHLGDDWNGTGGGNSDLGDPVFSISNGWVRRADDLKGGWGKVVRIVHLMVEDGDSTYVESIYAHLDSIMVEANIFVDHRQKIGSIGNANGQYWAHLHLEIRKEAGLPIGGGYSVETKMHHNPSEFIKSH